jgi:hypothetical protein
MPEIWNTHNAHTLLLDPNQKCPDVQVFYPPPRFTHMRNVKLIRNLLQWYGDYYYCLNVLFVFTCVPYVWLCLLCVFTQNQ